MLDNNISINEVKNFNLDKKIFTIRSETSFHRYLGKQII